MSLKKNGKGVISLGDATTHGGEVISAAHKLTDMGRRVACIGDSENWQSDLAQIGYDDFESEDQSPLP
jgi:uncharacterized Zn-binding protein involved in type VI secretion